MYFKDLKAGHPVYILDREKMTASTAKVTSVSLPHVDAKMGGAASLVVDLAVTIGETPRTYCMTADADTAYPVGAVISTNRENILREVEAIKIQSEQALAQVDAHKETLEKCATLLAELDPAAREKRETEARFERLENGLCKLANMLEKLVD